MKKGLFLLICLTVSLIAEATHNRAGEITYKWKSGFTYEFTITTYTKDDAPADRCELTIDFGDGNTAVFPRTNGNNGSCNNAKMGEIISPNIRENIYKGEYTYQAPGYYTISMQDLNRNGGINNIPNSINIPFYITTTLLVDPSVGTNSSPTLNYPPIDNGCSFQKFVHNPSAFDPDGDSLYYSLIDCKGLGGIDITETYDPLYIQDAVVIDSLSGDFIWDTPNNIGQFNFAILIQEYRKGNNGIWRLMGAVTRDFQVDIKPCQNQAPILDPVGPFCVIAGDQLQFVVSAEDPDQNNIRLTLEGSGGPFQTNPSATFPKKEQLGFQISQTFTWNTTCNLVRSQPYYAQFKVEDQPVTGTDDALVDIMSVEIKVIAPPPTNPLALPNQNSIDLSWNQEICTKANGYDIYRREGTYGYNWDTCETGVPDYTGYVYHASTSGLTATTYTDSIDIKVGVRYCYMVVATFPDGSESIASEEFCAELPKIRPIITNVDVLTTDVATGGIEIKWTPPKEFDSLAFPPPYSYIIERANDIDGGNFTQVGTTASFFDTVFTDQNIDTETRGYNYKIALVSNGAPAIYSDLASSIYLSISALDKLNLLKFNHVTPWVNDTFIVFRENAQGVFDSIGFSTNNSYLDTGLTNGTTYCYRALGIGAFSGSGLPGHLLNNSQISCATPTDTVRPCAPLLSFSADCEARELTITWTDDQASGCVSDIIEYRVYYKEKETDPWPENPTAVLPATQNSFTVQGDDIVGCYGITAVDDATPANESFVSDPVCLDGCPIIELPNVFTPNDGSSNLFFTAVIGSDGTPLFRDIDNFSLEVYNRWGGVVYKTSSAEEFIEKGWNGQDMNTGQDCAAGVYYYFVTYTPRSTKALEEESLKGFVHLFR